MSIKERTRSFIAARNGGFVASRIAFVAERYLNAYNNISNWDMRFNGELDALKRIVAALSGDIIDAGANQGQWASHVLPHCRDNRVHCFEPVPPVFAALERRLGGDPRVRLVNSGLGAREEIVEFNYNPAMSEMSSTLPLVFGREEDATRVRCAITTGDRYLAETGIDFVALLKIDVEGMEAECLAGFDAAFATRRIATVQFEHGPAHVHSGHTLKFFVDWFASRDFAVFTVFPGSLKPLDYRLTAETYAGQNFFAIRRDCLTRLGLA